MEKCISFYEYICVWWVDSNVRLGGASRLSPVPVVLKSHD